MMNDKASVNFYMFFGGTNFGFTAGANGGDASGDYKADLTSYDYDAPMDEAGDPTYKFAVIRNAIGEYLPLPDLPIPAKQLKMTIPAVTLKPTAVVLSDNGRKHLADRVVFFEHPLTFEQLGQYSGFVLYETNLPKTKLDPNLLNITRLGDRAYVYVDRVSITQNKNKKKSK
jgi:beta-galactosidase